MTAYIQMGMCRDSLFKEITPATDSCVAGVNFLSGHCDTLIGHIYMECPDAAFYSRIRTFSE
ncbi:hypothetical protein NXV03_12615 [Phocaeicola vulgatus]|nr:hypothetical protein [Bacteroides fragilis]MCS2370908.1 hypothetical protein [Phocaeicola vulgatus]